MAKHIKDKDKADLLTKKLGNQFDELSKTLQGLSFQELFRSSNQSLSLWQQKQNSSFFAFKKEVATTIQTEGKKLVNELKQGSKELGLTKEQTKTLVSQVNAGANYLNRAVIQGHQRNVSQIASSVKTIRSDAADVLYREIQKQVYRSNRTGVVYSVPTEDGNYKYRNWKWENYMEMKVRTDLQNEITENMIDAGNESGVVFYICSFYGDCAKDHVDYQGKIYYADGWHAFAPKDRADEIEAYIRANNLMSVREVTTNAPYLTTRPNCRHYFQYISIDEVLGIKSNNDLKKKRDDLNLNFNGKYQPDKYDALQQQRANERAIRETKSQIDILKMSIENAPKDIDKKELFTMNAQLTNLNHQLRERQKVQRKLIEKYDNLERRYDREKPGAMVSDMRVKANNLSVKENEKANKRIPDVVEVTADYKSKEYEERIKSLGFSGVQTKAIIKGIKRIFNNEKSKSQEGFYAVNLKNIKQTFYNGDGEPLAVKRPKEFENAIIVNENADYLVIHNHRGDTIPSPSDIAVVSQFENSNKGLVVGNGGSFYYYEINKKISLKVLKSFKENDDKCETMEQRKELLLKFCKENGIILIENKKEAS